MVRIKKQKPKQKKPLTNRTAMRSFEAIARHTARLGWNMGFVGDDVEGPVEYLILGKPDKVDWIVDVIEKARKKKA